MDEPSLGLAPILVQEVFRVIKEINASGATTILLVEQNATWRSPSPTGDT